MSKHFDLLYKFIAENEDRLELAFDIGTSWEELRKKLISTFLSELVTSLISKIEKSTYVRADHENYNIYIYKPEWTKDGYPLLCIRVDNVLYDDYLGIFRDTNYPLIVSNKDKIDIFFKEKELQKLFGQHMLADPEDSWVAWKYTGNNYAEIGHLKNLIGNKRQAIIEQYVTELKRLTDDFSPYIDNLIEELKTQET